MSTRSCTSLAALLIATVVTLPATVCAQAVAWAKVEPLGQPATFVPDPVYQFSTAFQPITVTRNATLPHRFVVSMPGMAPSSGAVHATAFGGNHTAIVEGWSAIGTTVNIVVELRNAAGIPAPNAPFTIYFHRGGADTRREAYLWANNATAPSYTPSTTFSWNGNRPDPTIVRLATGVYEVTLPGLAPAGNEGGHVQVTPYGVGARRAKVKQWFAVGNDLRVVVQSFYMYGVAADSQFVLSYNETAAPIDGVDGSGAHVWADQESATLYTPSPTYTDSNGLEGPYNEERIRRLSTGVYEVHLPNVAPFDRATAQVTGYGDDTSYASIPWWISDGCGGTKVAVTTFAPNGIPVDAKFTLLFLTNRPATQPEVAWAWVAPLLQPATFVPSASYQRTPTGQSITVQRDPVLQNLFRVKIPGVTSPFGNVQVSAYGGNHTAVINGWSLTGSTVDAFVELFTPTGAVANDANFTIHYRYGGNNRNREAYVFHNSLFQTSYTPNTDYSWNADRGDPTIQRTSTGVYVVTLPGLATTGLQERGHVQVSPVSSIMLRTKVSSWGSSGSDLQVTVRCFNQAGTPVNGLFTLSYNEKAAPIAVGEGSGAHVWANNPTALQYAPVPEYTDSNGTFGPANAEIVARFGVGDYRIDLPNVAPSDSSVALVSAYGSTSTYASLAGWMPNGNGGTVVAVRTYNASGAPADSQFNLFYLTNRPANGAEPAQNWVYGSGCYGMQLSGSRRPVLCLSWDLELNSVPAGALFGLVQLDLASQSLPIFAVAPGCSVYTGGAVTELFLLPLSNPIYSLPVPANPTLIGLSLYAQAGAYVPGLNAINLALSNGVRGVVGDI